MPNVFVTGASGFIGAHLVEQLVGRGDRVTCLVRRTSSVGRLERPDVRLAYGDVTDAESLRAPVAEADLVIHLAGVVKALRSDEFHRINWAGTEALVAACEAAATPPTVVVVSSLSAAGPSRDSRLVVETDSPAPVSHYGRSKRAAERSAEERADRVPISIVRPPIVFGEGDREMFEMIRVINRSGIHLVPGFAARRFSLIHAADLAKVLLLVADRGERLPAPRAGEETAGVGYYHPASDVHPTYAELGRMIGTALDRRVRVVHAPLLATWLVGGMGEIAARWRGRPSIINWDKAREATAGSWTGSPVKTRTQLGYEPGADLQQRLRQTIEWYRAEGWL